MKVGMITHDFYPPIGGQGVEAFTLYQQFNKKNHPKIVVFSSRENSLDNHIKISTPSNNMLGPLLFSIYVSLELNKIINTHKLDVLQFYGGPGGVFLLKKPIIPTIYIANHTYAQQFRHFKKWKYKILMLIEKIGYIHATKIISISSTTKKSLIDDYGIPPEKITVIPVTVDLSKFHYKNVKRIPHSVLYVGRLDKRKGIPYLIQAIKYVLAEVPTVTLYIIGEGNLKKRLKELIKKKGLQKHAVLLGKIPTEELVEWYNKVDVFTLPSLFEGFGIVLLEAMACRTPVIGTNTQGIVDVIIPGKTGILVPPKNAIALGKAIEQLLTTPKLRKRLSHNAYKRLSKDFSLDALTNRIIQQIEQATTQGAKNSERSFSDS
ncbi:glycosyltransferase family 4 protein [Thermococcus barossii]|uniref:Glycosyl transferase n=1 Tax=Thermococcus barossii TaxID=54077 RepID=A0A2Z2MLS8_9EURY|nr:glycosyltransferase family 4 protein [Thermococcus barossii]ASJ05722.1 hypothetical protein A3L01_10230 [Thermococcus barossii]